MGLPDLTERLVVLASASTYRAEILEAAGVDAVIDPPDIDERALDHLFADEGAERLALALGRAKAELVARRHPDAVVIGGDQVGQLDTPEGPHMLTKQPNEVTAIDQLMSMSGTTHRLVNGLVVIDTRSGHTVGGVDIQRVTMRRFDRAEATDYVQRFQPYDTAGSYRIEDGEQMEPGRSLVLRVVGEHPSGVIGLPLPLLGRLLSDAVRP